MIWYSYHRGKSNGLNHTIYIPRISHDSDHYIVGVLNLAIAAGRVCWVCGLLGQIIEPCEIILDFMLITILCSHLPSHVTVSSVETLVYSVSSAVAAQV